MESKRLLAGGRTPMNIRSISDNDSNSPSKIMGIKELLRYQMEEKKLLEIQTKLKDQEIMSALQEKDKNADDDDKKKFDKFKHKKEEYLHALREQMKENAKIRNVDNEMTDRERNLNKSKLEQLNYQSPSLIKKVIPKIDNKNKTRNNIIPTKPQTFDVIPKPFEENDFKTLDQTTDLKIPNIMHKGVKKLEEIENKKVLTSIDNITEVPPIPNSRNYHLAKMNTDIKQNLSTKVSKDSFIQNGKACLDTSYLKQSIGKFRLHLYFIITSKINIENRGQSFDPALPNIINQIQNKQVEPMIKERMMLNYKENKANKVKFCIS